MTKRARKRKKKMKVSQVELKHIAQAIREDEKQITNDEKEHLETLKASAIEYVKAYTGLNEEEIEKHEDITTAVLVLISDMYDNRQMYVEKTNINKVISDILGFYQVNLL